LQVIWTDGKTQELQHIPTNQLLTLNYADAKESFDYLKKATPRFRNITKATGIDFFHTEDQFNDFKKEPLLPHRNSQMGPALAVADVNNDQLDDFFIGNAKGQSGQLFFQKTDGTFEKQNGPWLNDAQYEDTGAVFFDADNDGDQDLYVVNGGNDSSLGKEYYQDRLYLNTASGFIKSENVLPFIPTSGQEVVVLDFDKDGRKDLFVAGRILPSTYPISPPSFLLKNKGRQDQSLKFENVTEAMAPEFLELGLVTAAIVTDFNKDGLEDLVLTGEWMNVRFFKNTKKGFEEVTESFLALDDMEGWWYSLIATDIDSDGSQDFLVGNLGLNYKYQASTKAPFEIFANDFDENKSLDIVLSYQKKGERLPVRGRECSSEQVPAIAKRFETYESFADADLNDIYGKAMLNKALHFQAKKFESVLLKKTKKGFEKMNLPAFAQISSINSIQAIDYNQDEFPDFLIFGNLYNSEVETPRNDGGVGLVLTGTKEGTFDIIPAEESGILITGEIKKVLPIRYGKDTAFLIAKNNDALEVYLKAND